MKTLVLAIGGNALLDFGEKPTFDVQYRNAMRLARGLGPLLKRKELRIVITHGNGPQVGDELIRNKFAERKIPSLPLHVLAAETQALIGTILEAAIRQELSRIGATKEVAVVLTHVCVKRSDKAFKNPTKPVGPFYTKEQLDEALRSGRFDFARERGHYRRVVASPEPLKILELDAIKELMKKEIVVAAGGGGIPVIEDGGAFRGVDAVIDKDATSQLLANELKADTLAILTNVDCVYFDFDGRKRPIRRIRAWKLKGSLDEFEEGTIRPKLSACIKFVESGGKAAYIGDLFKLKEMLAGKSGTKVVR